MLLRMLLRVAQVCCCKLREYVVECCASPKLHVTQDHSCILRKFTDVTVACCASLQLHVAQVYSCMLRKSAVAC